MTHLQLVKKLTLKELERIAIRDTLKANNGNMVHTARDLQISLRALYNKAKRHGIDPNDFRPEYRPESPGS